MNMTVPAAMRKASRMVGTRALPGTIPENRALRGTERRRTLVTTETASPVLERLRMGRERAKENLPHVVQVGISQDPPGTQAQGPAGDTRHRELPTRVNREKAAIIIVEREAEPMISAAEEEAEAWA